MITDLFNTYLWDIDVWVALVLALRENLNNKVFFPVIILTCNLNFEELSLILLYSMVPWYFSNSEVSVILRAAEAKDRAQSKQGRYWFRQSWLSIRWYNVCLNVALSH